MKKRKLNLTFPLTVTFVLMVLVVVYTSALFYRISVSNVYEVGQDKISGRKPRKLSGYHEKCAVGNGGFRGLHGSQRCL